MKNMNTTQRCPRRHAEFTLESDMLGDYTARLDSYETAMARAHRSEKAVRHFLAQVIRLALARMEENKQPKQEEEK